MSLEIHDIYELSQKLEDITSFEQTVTKHGTDYEVPYEKVKFLDVNTGREINQDVDINIGE